MDSIISSPGSGKLHGKDEDIFSKLPDSVFHYILSFLSTKDAVRTSILARRWKFLWTHLCDFNLVNYYPSSTNKNENQNQIGKSLLNTVDTLLHKASHIKRFRFKSRGITIDADQANSWISAVLKHKVEELNLSLNIRTSLVLANSFSAPESLNKLNLELGGCVLNIPNCICFPGLKTLTLSCVTFSDESSTQQLFSGCPVLQSLSLYNCGWKSIKNVSIKLPTISALIIYHDDPSSADELLNCKVTIDAVNLVNLSYTSYLTVEYVLINLTSLIGAHVDVTNYWPPLKQLAVPRAVKFLSGISHAKSLTLSNDTLEYLSDAENLLSLLPTFHNLVHISVLLVDTEFTSKALFDILEKSPNLKVLNIPQGLDPEIFLNGEEWIFNSVPHCIKSSLRSVFISNFEGSAAEMQWLNLLLKNATVLENITMFCKPSLSADWNKQAEIWNQLQTTRRGLANCVIDFQRN